MTQALVWLLLIGLLMPTMASAHLLNMTQVKVVIDPDGPVTAEVQLDLTRAADGGAAYFELSQSAAPLQDPRLAPLWARLTRAFELTQGDASLAWTIDDARLPQLSEAEFLSPVNWPMTTLHLHATLPAPGDRTLPMQARFDGTFPYEEPIALTLSLADGSRRQSRWLVAGQRSPHFALSSLAMATVVEPEPPMGPVVAQYIRLGFDHILPRGLDHVLFVIGLLLGARNLRSLLALVTCFTLAHSVTLILSSLGAVRAPAAVVEPLIAASIVWIGVENLRQSGPGPWRYVVVFAFGLLHGLGFASALSTLGLPKAHFFEALISFNLGVELGQLTVILAVWLPSLYWRNRPGFRRFFAVPGSMLIAVVAAVWFVQRIGWF